MGRSVFAVDRRIWEPGNFPDESFSTREAWIWLVGAAAWRSTRTRGNVGRLNLERGEFSFSVRFLADKFQWSKSRVDRFISALQKRDTIEDTSRDNAKVYKISNYNHFQIIGLPSGTPSGTAAGQQRDKEETLNLRSSISSLRSDIPAWVPKEAWNGFVEMRKKIRAPMTPRAAELIIAKLDKLREQGHDPSEVLNQSVESSWKGIFPIKQENRDNGRKTTAHDRFLTGGLLALESRQRQREGQP